MISRVTDEKFSRAMVKSGHSAITKATAINYLGLIEHNLDQDFLSLVTISDLSV